MVSVVVTRNYQITLPKPIRKGVAISVGDIVVIEARGEEIVLKKIERDPVNAAFGVWRGKIKEESTAYVDKLRESWKERKYA